MAALVLAAAVAALLAALVALALAVVGPADGGGEPGPALLTPPLDLLTGLALLLADLGRDRGRTEPRQPAADLVEVLRPGRAGRTALDGPRRVVGTPHEPAAVLLAPRESRAVAVARGEELHAGLLQRRELVAADAGDRRVLLAVLHHEVVDRTVATLAAAAVRHAAAVDGVSALGPLDPDFDLGLVVSHLRPEVLGRGEGRDLGVLLVDETLGQSVAGRGEGTPRLLDLRVAQRRELVAADPEEGQLAVDRHHHEALDLVVALVVAADALGHPAGEHALRGLPDLGHPLGLAGDDRGPVGFGRGELARLAVLVADEAVEEPDLAELLPLRVRHRFAAGIADRLEREQLQAALLDLDEPTELDLADRVAARVSADLAYPRRLGEIGLLGYGRRLDGRLGLLRLRRLDHDFLEHDHLGCHDPVVRFHWKYLPVVRTYENQTGNIHSLTFGLRFFTEMRQRNLEVSWPVLITQNWPVAFWSINF